MSGLGHYPAFVTEVECSGALHRLRWEAGALLVLDHSDPEGERALAALGGPRCHCIDVLDGWVRHDHDLRVLTLASRGPSDEIRVSESPTASGLAFLTNTLAPIGRVARFLGSGAQSASTSGVARAVVGTSRSMGSGGWAGYAPNSATNFDDHDELTALLAVDGGLAHRLSVTVAARWAQRLAATGTETAAETEAARPALAAALYGRVAATVAHWSGRSDRAIDVVMLARGGQPAITRVEADTGVGSLRIALPFDWLVEVWGRGFGVVMDRFVLAATAESTAKWHLLSVDSALGPPRRLTISLD